MYVRVFKWSAIMSTFLGLYPFDSARCRFNQHFVGQPLFYLIVKYSFHLRIFKFPQNIIVSGEIMKRGVCMGYMDNYERDAYGIVAFWLRNNLEHGQFFDREISHHELELARVNQSMVQNLAGIWQRAEAKQEDLTLRAELLLLLIFRRVKIGINLCVYNM